MRPFRVSAISIRMLLFASISFSFFHTYPTHLLLHVVHFSMTFLKIVIIVILNFQKLSAISELGSDGMFVPQTVLFLYF